MPHSFVVNLAGAAVLSFGADALARPGAGWKRTPAALALHLVSVSLIGCLAFALTHRSHFSALVPVALVALLAGMSNAKHASLREPLVFTDLSLFSQLFAHPRLYLPFLNLATILAIGLGVVAVALGFMLDPAISGVGMPAFAAATLSLAACYVFAKRLPLAVEPSTDQIRHGFFAVFMAYLLNGLRRDTFRELHTALRSGWFALAGTPDHRPDVVIIQSESFFDVRKLAPTIRRSVLAQFDRACGEAWLHGELEVPAWGANTMRSEFALLTGIEPARLGYARFYPYAFLWRAGASLASWFGRAAYRTLAIHPYPADFFGRDRAFRHLGFEHFVDLNAFETAPRVGAYVADRAVADKIIETLDGSATPQLIFAVTMENHGPFHLESVAPGEGAAFHSLGDVPELHELTAYLRHLVNADAMIGQLLAYLRTRPRETLVCFYGDHVPAMSRVYRHIGCLPSQSDFLIWTNYGAPVSEPVAPQTNFRIDELGLAIIGAMDSERVEKNVSNPHLAPVEMT